MLDAQNFNQDTVLSSPNFSPDFPFIDIDVVLYSKHKKWIHMLTIKMRSMWLFHRLNKCRKFPWSLFFLFCCCCCWYFVILCSCFFLSSLPLILLWIYENTFYVEPFFYIRWPRYTRNHRLVFMHHNINNQTLTQTHEQQETSLRHSAQCLLRREGLPLECARTHAHILLLPV